MPSRRSAEHGFVSSRRSAEHGFTLIEAMVALAVFGLAALALVKLLGATAMTTARLEERQVGQIVARGVALAALTDPAPPPLGREDGRTTNAGREWAWTRRVDRIGDGALLRMEVRVSDAAGAPAGALTLFRSAR